MRCASWPLVLVAVGVALLLAGCGRAKQDALPKAPESAAVSGQFEPAEPERALYEQCRAGAVQLAGVADTVAEALQSAEDLKKIATGESKQPIADAVESIDSAGAGIAEFTQEPPVFEAFKKEFAKHDERRLKAIEAANDALVDLQSASGALSVLEEGKSPLRRQVQDLLDELDTAIDDLQGAIEAMGGKVEEQV